MLREAPDQLAARNKTSCLRNEVFGVRPRNGTMPLPASLKSGSFHGGSAYKLLIGGLARIVGRTSRSQHLPDLARCTHADLGVDYYPINHVKQ